MQLRPAEPADALEVAGVHIRSWQVAYRGIFPDEYLDNLRPDERAERYTFGDPDPAQPTTVVAVAGGAIRGFATTGPARDDDAQPGGELFAIYVDPDHWGTGAGRMLMTDARQRLAREGYRNAALWVLVDNQRAISFYQRDGWQPDGSRRIEHVWGVPADEVRYRRPLP